ncbi:hypothetical protein [Duganella vulcania]|uniref:Uncharacterized protein n=1 Tax=Duganella vulcania TaxID=2692166 RepID=A0A845GI55_9BURK|nr:hypothetical protein [Duganella vulcania]MYM92738.1 hypothetical protein [Duganella vulcania]
MGNGNNVHLLISLSLAGAFLCGEIHGRADTGKPSITLFKAIRWMFYVAVSPLIFMRRAFLWYRNSKQRAQLQAMALASPVPALDITPKPARSVVKDICPGVQVVFAISQFDVVPTLHVKPVALITKLGGETMQLRGYSIGSDFDLALFNGIVLRVTEHVLGLLASLDYQIESVVAPEQQDAPGAPELFDGAPERVVVKDLCSGVQVKLLKFPRHIVPELWTCDALLIEKLGGNSMRLAAVDFPVFDLTVLSGICLDVMKQATDILATLGFHVACPNANASPAADRVTEVARDADEVPVRVLWKDVCPGVRLKLNVYTHVVEPEVHVSTVKLKQKLGGEVMPLKAVAMEKFDLDALTGILFTVSSQVLSLVSSLDETKPVLVQAAVAGSMVKRPSTTLDIQPEVQKEIAVSVPVTVSAASMATAPAQSAAASVSAVSNVSTTKEDVVVGKLEQYGLDKRTLNDVTEGPKVRDCYFADVRTASGQVVRKWGIDLERAIGAANVDIGDSVSITFTGKVGRKNTYIVRRG